MKYHSLFSFLTQPTVYWFLPLLFPLACSWMKFNDCLEVRPSWQAHLKRLGSYHPEFNSIPTEALPTAQLTVKRHRINFRWLRLITASWWLLSKFCVCFFCFVTLLLILFFPDWWATGFHKPKDTHTHTRAQTSQCPLWSGGQRVGEAKITVAGNEKK